MYQMYLKCGPLSTEKLQKKKIVLGRHVFNARNKLICVYSIYLDTIKKVREQITNFRNKYAKFSHVVYEDIL